MMNAGGFAPQRLIDQKKEEEKKAEQTQSYVEKQLALYDKMALDDVKKSGASST